MVSKVPFENAQFLVWIGENVSDENVSGALLWTIGKNVSKSMRF